jgi:hypothetical protein
VGEITLAGLHESSAGFDLMADIVSWVGRNDGCQQSGDGNGGEELHFELRRWLEKMSAF